MQSQFTTASSVSNVFRRCKASWTATIFCAPAWDGLRQPSQVIVARARLPVQALDWTRPTVISPLELHARLRHPSLPAGCDRAPLLRLDLRRGPGQPAPCRDLLLHRMWPWITAPPIEVVCHEMQACLLGQGTLLGEPCRFRNYVAQARLGISEQDHESFFQQMLGDIAPTLAVACRMCKAMHGIAEISLPLAADCASGCVRRARLLGVSAATSVHLGWAQVLGVLAREPTGGVRHLLIGLALGVGHVQPGAVLPVGGVRVTGGHTGRVVGSVAVEVPLIGQRLVSGSVESEASKLTVSGAAPPEVGSASRPCQRAPVAGAVVDADQATWSAGSRTASRRARTPGP